MLCDVMYFVYIIYACIGKNRLILCPFSIHLHKCMNMIIVCLNAE